MKRLPAALLGILCFLSACQTETGGSDIEITCITNGSTEITETSAKLSGYVDLPGDLAGRAELGFLYSTDDMPDPSHATLARKSGQTTSNLFNVTVSGLEPGTTYYFRAYCLLDGRYTLGAVLHFTTQDNRPKLHKCSETRITDDMIFSSCCSRTTTTVQQSFDYDPVENTVYFCQLNRLYRNLISWTTPEVTLSTAVPAQTMILSCFSHGNNIVFERTADGGKYIWTPNFGTRGDGSYNNPWIVSRIPLQTTSGVANDIKNTDPDDNYYFGVSPCWPAIDFDADLIAVCTYKKVYLYRLSQVRALPKTTVKIPKVITYGGTITNGTSTFDSLIPEFVGQPEVLAHDATTLTPLIVFDSNYSARGLHWQTFCINGGKAYFLLMGEVPDDSIIRHDTYIEVYDLTTGKLIREKVRQEYIQDHQGLAARGYVDPDYCYAEPEGIKVMGETMYVMYTCRGNTTATTRRPVVFKISSDV